MFEEPNKENFDRFLLIHLRSPKSMDEEDFDEIKGRLLGLKKLFSKFSRNGILRERLILNNLIFLFNVLETDACIKAVRFTIEANACHADPFFVFLGRLKETHLNESNTHPKIVEALRKI